MVRPCDAKHVFAVPTWRAGGLSKWVVGRVISTLKGTLIGVMILTRRLHSSSFLGLPI